MTAKKAKPRPPPVPPEPPSTRWCHVARSLVPDVLDALREQMAALGYDSAAFDSPEGRLARVAAVEILVDLELDLRRRGRPFGAVSAARRRVENELAVAYIFSESGLPASPTRPGHSQEHY